MSFVSISFILYFLVPLLVIYYLVPKKLKDIVLFIASLIFCAAAGPMYFVVPLALIILNYIMGHIVGRHRRLPWLMTAAVINTVIPLALGLSLTPEALHERLPELAMFCGSCMCSLRALSYLTDLYKGTTAIQSSPFKFGLYMLYFPAFAAGPVISYNDFRLKLCHRKHRSHEFLCGTMYFVCGILKKVILADRLEVLWNTIRVSDYTVLTAANAWFGLTALVLCIVISVSSYWDCAVGMCRMTGFEVSRVFHPIQRIKKSGAFSILGAVPIAAAIFCIVRLHDMSGARQYINALSFRTSSGLHNLDFMYRLNSNRILLIVSIIAALHIPSLIVRLTLCFVPKKEHKDNTVKSGAALVIIALMLAVSALNTLYAALHAENAEHTEPLLNVNSVMDGSYIREKEKHIADISLYKNELDMINSDVGYLMGISGVNGVYYAKGNTLIECPPPYNERNVDAAIEKLDAISDSERYTMELSLIPPSYETYEDRMPEYAHDGRVKKVQNRVCTLLNGSPIKLFDASDALETANVDNVYYSTSPSLNAYGVYALYQALASELDYEAYDYGAFNFKTCEYTYEGELMHRAGNHFTRKDNYTEPEKPESEFDNGVVISHSDAQRGRALAVVADTSAPDIDMLMSKNFDTVYMIDINTSAEDINMYLSDKFITDVIAVCSTDYIAEGRD